MLNSSNVHATNVVAFIVTFIILSVKIRCVS